MVRPRNPKRDEAYQIWLKSNGTKQLKDIAKELGITPSQIRNWKTQDSWEGDSIVAQRNSQSLRNETKKGAPKKNSNAVTHGFFRTIFPDDEETNRLVEAINEKGPLDMLWDNIVIQYTAIARAQKIMFVQDKDDLTKELKKTKSGESSWEEEYELQFAWDKQKTFMDAQSRAMSTLSGLIKQFEELAHVDDERRLKLEAMQLDIDKKQEEVKKLKEGSDGQEITVIVDDIEDFEDD